MMLDVFPRLAGTLLPGVICRSNPEAIYLTFDDGPDPEVTPRLLETLHQHEVRATFFVRGRNAGSYPDIVRQSLESGHAVGIHGFDHRSMLFAGYNSALTELTRTCESVRKATGTQPRLYRPPYGRFSPGVLRAARELGLTTTLWSRSAADWKPVTADQIVDRVAPGVRPGDIILLHDQGDYTRQMLEALPTLIKRLKDVARLEALGGVDE